MIDEQQLTEKIQQLESEAKEIEYEMEQFFLAIEVKKPTPPSLNQLPTSLFPPSTSFSDYEKFIAITGNVAISHRMLIKRYEMWYNNAHSLIQNYCKDKEANFVKMHDGIRESYTGPAFKTGAGSVTKNITVFYGISELLQFDSSVRYSVHSSQEFIQKITGLFSIQRGILLSLPEIIPLYLRTVHEQINAEIFADFLEMAEFFLSKDEQWKNAAAFLIGGVLEEHIRKLAIKNQIPIKNSKDRFVHIEDLNTDLRKIGIYTDSERKQITALLAIRNDADHAHWDSYSKERVETMLLDVRRIISQYPA